ncbi:MAG: EF-hand domain-containing protein [Flavobacteriaceae bacterium]
MYKRTVKLGVLVLALSLFASCKMNAQNSNNKQERKEPPTTAELFKQMDKDEDGLISEKEAKGPLKNDFAKIDTDEDGFLSTEEVEKAPKPKREGGRPQGKQ